MADRNLSDLDPALRPLAQQFLDQCKEAGINAFITQTYRDEADQNSDYASGRGTPGPIITNAQYGQSPHNCTTAAGVPSSAAFDFAIIAEGTTLDWNASDPSWQKAISIGEGLGLISGSEWHCGLKDNPHFELSNWRANLPESATSEPPPAPDPEST